MFTKIVICTVLLVSSLCVASIEAQIYANGTVLKDDADNICTKTGPQCSADCVTLLLCAAGIVEPLATVNCGISSPLTPYCQNNACSRSPGDCSSASTFRCTSEGIFPDPNNCTRYVSCDENSIGSAGVTLECANGFFYNSQINICEKGKLSHHSKACNTVDCSKKTNEVVVYRSNPEYYAFCYVDPDSGRRETMMFHCDVEGEIYDPKENACVFGCMKAGHFQDPANCNYYYVCSGNNKADRIKCPPNYFFDGTMCTTDSSKCSPEALEAALTEV